MSSTIRFTPDFIKACESLWRDGFTKGVNGEDEFPDFKIFFKDTNTKVKEDPSYEEMEKLPFNPSKCEARIEKHGYAIQCTRNPFEGGCLCKTHQNILNKLPEGKDIPYGRFNQPRPDITLDKGNPISWGPKKSRVKNSSKNENPKLKVGEMRDYLSSRIPVEDFRGLKKRELTEMYLKVKEKENSSPTSSDTSSEDSPTTTQPEVQEQSEVQETPEQTEVQEENNNETSQMESVENEISQKEDDGKGTGLSLVPETPKTVSDFKSLFKELNIDTEGLKGIRAYKQAYDDYLKEKEEEKTEPLSDDDDELQEDTHTYDETDFEGVSYLEDEDSGKIYNLKHQHVGKWNADFDNIIWVSEEFKTAHETSRP